MAKRTNIKKKKITKKKSVSTKKKITKKKPVSSNPIDMKVIAAAIILIVAAGAFIYYFTAQKPTQNNQQMNQDDKVAATLNGEEIYRSQVLQVQSMMQQQGLQADESVALERIIAEKLLLTEVEERGITVSKEEAEASLGQMLQLQGTDIEQVKGQMTDEQFDQVIEQRADQMKIQALAEEETDTEVSEEEAMQFFEDNKEAILQGQNATYEEVSDQIKNYILQQRLQQAITQLLQQLRAEADVTMADGS